MSLPVECCIVHNYRIPFPLLEQFQKSFKPLFKKLPPCCVLITVHSKMPPITQCAYYIQPLKALTPFDIFYLPTSWRSPIFPLYTGVYPALVRVYPLFYWNFGYPLYIRCPVRFGFFLIGKGLFFLVIPIFLRANDTACPEQPKRSANS